MRVVGLLLILSLPNVLLGGVQCNDTKAGLAAGGSSKIKVKNSLNLTNGTLQQGANATLEGSNINLNQSQLVVQNGINSTVSGVYDANANRIALSSTTITSQPGTINQNVTVAGNSTLEGLPSLTSLNLAAATARLTVNVSTPVNTNIGASGGTVSLAGNTSMGNGSKIKGNARLEFNGNSFNLGGTPVTYGDTTVMKSAQDLIFNTKITLTGEWVFDGDGQISGNGNLLDISQGGTIALRPNTNINMSNLVLRGLGIGQIQFYDSTSTLSLTNVQIELDRNYTVTIGGIYMDGPTNVVTSNYVLTFANQGTATVDNIALTYDTLSFGNNNNIQPLPADQKHLTLLNNGVVRRLDNFDNVNNNSNTLLFLSRNNSNSILFNNRTTSNALLFGDRNNSNALLFGDRNNSNTMLFLFRSNSNQDILLARSTSNALLFNARTTSAALLFLTKNNSNAIVNITVAATGFTTVFGPGALNLTGNTYTSQFDIFLSGDHPMAIAPGVGNSFVFDGNGHTLHFAAGASSILGVAAGINVLFQNVVFQNYNDAALALGAGATIAFGDGVRLELNEAQQLQRTWTFAGTTELRGYGNVLNINPYSIQVSPNSSLSLQNVSLDGLKASNITCGGPTASLILQDCNLCLENNFNFTVGSILFSHDVHMTGTNTFTYASNSSSTIDSCSQLFVDGAGFAYAPLITNRDLISMTDQTSVLRLANSSLSTTITGMRLTVGTLLVDGKNQLINTGAVALSEGFCFGDGTLSGDITIQLNPGASLSLVDGVLDYQNVN